MRATTNNQHRIEAVLYTLTRKDILKPFLLIICFSAILFLILLHEGCPRSPNDHSVEIELTRSRIAILETSLYVLFLRHDRFPTDEEGLSALYEKMNIENSKGPYLVGNMEECLDEWGNPFEYEIQETSNNALVKSLGPDTISGTSDDIVVIVERPRE